MSVDGVPLELDISVDENGVVEGGAAEPVLKAVRPRWDLNLIRYKEFSGGITNRIFGCYLKDDQDWEDLVLVRVYGFKTDLMIDRNAERAKMQLLHAAGVAPPLYCSFQNGLAYGYIRGECIDGTLVREEHIGRLVARELARVHSIDFNKFSTKLNVSLPKTNSFSTHVHKWMDLIPESFSDPEKNDRFKKIVKSKCALQEEINNLEKELKSVKSPVVFCHCDLLPANIIHNKEKDKCSFIDFEYSGMCWGAFDIATHFCEWAGVDEIDYALYPDYATQCRWLRHYLTEKQALSGDTEPVTEQAVRELYVAVNKFSLACHIFCGVWALTQSCFSVIDFDYLHYAELRFDEYFRRRDEYLASS